MAKEARKTADGVILFVQKDKLARGPPHESVDTALDSGSVHASLLLRRSIYALPPVGMAGSLWHRLPEGHVKPVTRVDRSVVSSLFTDCMSAFQRLPVQAAADRRLGGPFCGVFPVH